MVHQQAVEAFDLHAVAIVGEREAAQVNSVGEVIRWIFVRGRTDRNVGFTVETFGSTLET